MLSIIVAKAKNNIIGKDNKLLWNIPEDMKRFKSLTTGHTIIMGRKTFESIGKVLPERKHVIFSQNLGLRIDDENVKVVHSLAEIQEYITNDEENFVIGGAMIYNLLMPQVKKMYITEINENFDGDTVFPKIDETKWKEIERIKGNPTEDIKFDYDFVTYERI